MIKAKSDDQAQPAWAAPGGGEGAAGADAKRAILEVRAAMARHEVTGNPVFIWEAIGQALAPEVGDHWVPLSPEMRQYLHALAKEIVIGALGRRSEFRPRVLNAMGIGGDQGASVAKEYAKFQSAGVLLGIYGALKRRHGSEEALKMMAGRLMITPKRVGARVSEARDHLVKALDKLGYSDVDREKLGVAFGDDISDLVLLNFTQGLPDLLWREGKEHRTSKASRKKRGPET